MKNAERLARAAAILEEITKSREIRNAAVVVSLRLECSRSTARVFIFEFRFWRVNSPKPELNAVAVTAAAVESSAAVDGTIPRNLIASFLEAWNPETLRPKAEP